VITIIDSVHKQEPKRASPVRVDIPIYIGSAEIRSELCRSIVTMVQATESRKGLNLAWRTVFPGRFPNRA
jgi:hypothetical protein